MVFGGAVVSFFPHHTALFQWLELSKHVFPYVDSIILIALLQTDVLIYSLPGNFKICVGPIR